MELEISKFHSSPKNEFSSYLLAHHPKYKSLYKPKLQKAPCLLGINLPPLLNTLFSAQIRPLPNFPPSPLSAQCSRSRPSQPNSPPRFSKILYPPEIPFTEFFGLLAPPSSFTQMLPLPLIPHVNTNLNLQITLYTKRFPKSLLWPNEIASMCAVASEACPYSRINCPQKCPWIDMLWGTLKIFRGASAIPKDIPGTDFVWYYCLII